MTMFADQVAARAVVEHVELLAGDVGRLRRRFAANPAWTGSYLCDRLAWLVEELDALLQPCAAELVAAGDDVDDALRTVDRRSARLRHLLRKTTR